MPATNYVCEEVPEGFPEDFMDDVEDFFEDLGEAIIDSDAVAWVEDKFVAY